MIANSRARKVAISFPFFGGLIAKAAPITLSQAVEPGIRKFDQALTAGACNELFSGLNICSRVGQEKDMQNDWFDDDCPLCKQLKEDIENGLAEEFDWEERESEVDRLAMIVQDYIDSGHLDDAEGAARTLLAKFPEDVEGLEGMAKVAEAKGEYPSAIKYYESAIALTHVYQGYDDGTRDYFRDAIKKLKSRMV